MVRVSPDDRPLTEETTKPAERGKPKADAAKRGAVTWLREADRSVGAAIRYYRTAGDYYRKSGHPTLAEACYRKATRIEVIVQEG